ncbi:uncharacterized protein KY384_007028 [Bacidia gigantensis]|uniref:uncharacterized protein n=1 Tax=Bacidia gigantensis TaxID=2732470 RepID=UPI001D04776E|nr:uncharacterized protein KY384_007028 [Bacidia gigantensis]KAG8528112.1 hypothetical protein KY384_007028 [Bacidia gigantensis]
MAPLTVSKALDQARDNNETSPAATHLLEKTDEEVWTKIQQHPTTYVMNREEYAVLNFFNERHKNHPHFKPAVARFWANYKGDPAQVDGTSSSSGASKK